MSSSSSSYPSKEVPPCMPATFEQKSTAPLMPPPSYQEEDIHMNDLPGQTYYQPPPQPTSYPPPPIHEIPAQRIRSRVVDFYSPPDNRRLGFIRRITTLICALLILALIIALIAGFTGRYNNGSRYCECRTDSDCVSLYGPNVYCYSSCECGVY